MAGRVLSKANENALRAAVTTLLAVLEQVAGDVAETSESMQRMREAANLGDWLESRLHLLFTEIADNLFGDGRLTREERIGLSSAIGAALDAFRSEVGVRAVQLYQRGPWEELPTLAIGEALVEDVSIDLVEARRDGTARLRLIGPGWGSSGYYPAAVLERDGPAIFRAGTKMYWNHPTPTQEAERPEGDLNDLAAELTSDARWEDGEKGPGLYANARVFGSHKVAVAELAPHIGVSIRAAGRAVLGEAEGRKGRIIQALTGARSVDFVTNPGAGGRIVEVSEAARGAVNSGTVNSGCGDNAGLSHEENQRMELQEQLNVAQARVQELEAQVARLSEGALLSGAQDVVREELAAQRTLPDVTRRRLTEMLAVNPPVVNGAIDGEALRVRVREAAAAELRYLAEAGVVGDGRIRAANSQTGGGQEDAAAQERMVESFRALGLSESAAKVAVAGRR